MSSILQCICCCCYDQQQTPVVRTPRKKKTQKKQKQNRLITKYKRQQFVLIDEQSRNTGRNKAYCCPIQIFACSQCVNFICFTCLQGYYKKNQQNKTKLKCPFCNSITSFFVDYQLQPHSYFDKTNPGGFLTKQQRQNIDQQIKRREEEEKSQQQMGVVQNNREES